MGKRGFSSQPKSVAIAKGSYRPYRYEDQVELELPNLNHIPPPPDTLNEDGVYFWNNQLSYLIGVNGLMMKSDVDAFEQLAVSYQNMKENLRIMKKLGTTVTNDKGNVVISPYWHLYQDSYKQFINLTREFGCTPSARTRIKLEKAEQGPKLSDLTI